MLTKGFSKTMTGLAVAALAAAPVAYAGNHKSSSANASANISVSQQTQLSYDAAGVLNGQMQQPPKQRIPQKLVDQARCIGVFPMVFKEGLIAAGSNGNGVVSCRTRNGSWSHATPVFYNVSAGSVGFQAGAKVTQLVILFMNKKAAHQLGLGHFKLGGNVGIAAGPLGLHADVHNPPAPVLSYRVDSTGGFAGAEIKGTTLTADEGSNKHVYGQHKSTKALLYHPNQQVPNQLQVYTRALQRFAPASRYNG